MGQSRLQPIFLVYFQYKTTQSILFTTPNSVYCLSNIATATATEVSLLKKRFNFFLFHQIHPVSSVIELQSHFKWSIHFHFEIDFCAMTILWQIIYLIRFFCCMYMTKNDYFFIPCSHSSMLYHIFRGNTLQIKEKEIFFSLPSFYVPESCNSIKVRPFSKELKS